MKTKYVLTAITIGLLSVSSLNAQETKQNKAKHDQTDKKHMDKGDKEMSQVAYSCSMKCEGEKTYGKVGNCPKCGMNLTKMEMDDDKEAKTYTCSMHPEVKSDEPGDCSKCGMVLTDKKEEKKEKKEKKMKDEHKGHNH